MFIFNLCFYLNYSEVVNGATYDSKCDVFSFAIIMYQIMFDTSKPYGDDINSTYNIELRVAREDDFRPLIPGLQVATTKSSKANEDGNGSSEAETKSTRSLSDYYSATECRVIELMQQCWARNPHLRPPFAELAQEFAALLEAESNNEDEHEMSNTHLSLSSHNSSTHRLLTRGQQIFSSSPKQSGSSPSQKHKYIAGTSTTINTDE